MGFETALILFGLTSVILLFIEVNFTYATQGYAYGWSANRDPGATFSPLAQRMKNAYQNHVESATYGIPALAGGAVVGLDSPGAQMAALLFVVGRAAYAPLYWSGIPYARLPAFGLATLSAMYLYYALLTA